MRLKSQSSRVRAARGFTLIEITFAVLVLSGALVTLLGLQASSVKRTLHDRSMQQAMLAARQVLSQLESDDEAIEPIDKTFPLKDFLETYAPEQSSEEKGGIKTEIPDMQVHFKVENWGIPGIESETPMRRLTIDISWSDDPVDHLEVMYFVPVLTKS